MFEYVCENCGKHFQHKKRNRKYCSRECFQSDPNRGQKISQAKKGKSWEEMYGPEQAQKRKLEWKKKFSGSNNPFYGKKHSEDSKLLISESKKGYGIGRQISQEARDKIRQKATGRKHTEGTKRKISEAKKGVPIKRTKIQKHYKTSQLEAEFQKRYPDAVPKYTAYGYEWDFYWQGWLVEIDGIYWHGLDRNGDYSITQKNSITNDKNKNRAALENNAKLMRFKGTRGAKLEHQPYFVIENRRIKNMRNDELFVIDGQELSKDYISSLTIQERENLVETITQTILSSTFPYYENEEEVKRHYSLLLNNDMKLKGGCLYNNDSVATNICRYFCKSFYAAREQGGVSMLDVWSNPGLIRRLVRNRLGVGWHNAEPFSINLNMMVQGMRSMRLASMISMFKPRIAKWVYKNYCKTGDKVYDFSAGFGGRMLGASAAGVKYIGVDPLTTPELESMKNYFGFDAELISGCSEEVEFEKNIFDLAFSSPPYYNQEIYSFDESQAYNKGYDYFINMYWVGTLENIKKSLKNGSYFILNLHERYTDMLKETNKRFKLIDKIGLRTTKSHLNKQHTNTKMNEYLWIYKGS